MLKKKTNKNPHKNLRLFFIFTVVLLVYIGLIGRIYYIMIVNGTKYKALAVNQWTDKISIAPKRGSILDRNGHSLAVSADVYRIDADLSVLGNAIENKKMTIESLSANLSKLLNIDAKELSQKLISKDSNGNPLRFVSLKRQVEKNTADSIKNLKLNGLIVTQDIKRYYPNGNFLSQTLGLTNMAGSGITGVEMSYDKYLTGVPGAQVIERDRDDNELPYDENTYVEPVNGKDIVLTIDERIQEIAEDTALHALTANKANAISIMVMNPKNGDILAMTSKPDYDPNNPEKGSTSDKKVQEMWKNRSVEDVFEPGSIFKVISSAAAMENNAVSDNDRFNDPGSIKVANTVIYDDDKMNHGMQSLSDIIKNSSNVGFIQLAQKLGKEKLYSFTRLMGFGQKTGVDLPGESTGILKDLKNIGPVELATMSFGHGIALTQVQYMAAFNAVANGGTWIRPHIMKEIVHKDGDKQIVDEEFKDYDKKPMMSAANAAKLRTYLERVVTEGTATATYMEGYHIAGKTGTAEKVDTVKGGYEEGNYVSSFAGMAPASDPVVTIIVTVDKPDSSNYFAAGTAVPVAKELFTGIANYINIK